MIGIAGGTGSGKTTITRHICKRFGGDVGVVYHDNYYKRHGELPYEQRAKLNYDHPDAFDTDLMIEHLQMLKSGKSIACPIYDFSQHNRTDRTVMIPSARVIVVEGILVFCEKELRELLNIKIYVDTDADVRVLRRVIRDVRERGRSIESVVEQYLKTVKPMHEAFVEPSKRYADIIIAQGGYNSVALEMIDHRIAKHLNG